MAPPTPKDSGGSLLRAVLTKSASKGGAGRRRTRSSLLSENTPDTSTDSMGRK